MQGVNDKPHDLDIFLVVLNSALSTKETTHKRKSTNIENALVKQQADYKRCHQLVYSQLNIDDKVLLQNQKRQGRTSGIFP